MSGVFGEFSPNGHFLADKAATAAFYSALGALLVVAALESFEKHIKFKKREYAEPSEGLKIRVCQ